MIFPPVEGILLFYVLNQPPETRDGINEKYFISWWYRSGTLDQIYLNETNHYIFIKEILKIVNSWKINYAIGLGGMKKNSVKISSNRSFGFLFFVVLLAVSLWPLKSQGDLRLWAFILSLLIPQKMHLIALWERNLIFLRLETAI